MTISDTDEPDEYVLAAAVELATTLRSSKWSVKARILRAFYTGLRGTDSAWVKEQDRVVDDSD